MKNIFRICKQDINNIIRVPLVGLLLLGLAILPSLYAWFNIKAYWDPYSNTENIQIAVVNEDEGASFEGETINVGEQLTDQLEENKGLGWTFVTKDEANKGVKYGDYYASIYINSSFSNDLLSVLEGEPKPAEIDYKVNEKINAVAPKMTSAGASTIVEQLSSQFTKEASNALFSELNAIGVELDKQLPTIRKLEQRVFELEDKFPEINNIASKIIAIDGDWGAFENKAQTFLELEDYFPKIDQGADQILALEQKLPDIRRAGNQILEIEQNIPKMQEAADAIDRVDSHFSDISSELEKAQKQLNTAQQAINRANQAMPAIEETAKSAEDVSNAFVSFTNRMEGTAEPVLNVVQQDAQFLEHTAGSVDDVLASFDVTGTSQQIQDTLQTLTTQIESSLHMTEHALDLFTTLNETLPGNLLQGIIDRLSTKQTHEENLIQTLDKIETSLQNNEQPAEHFIQQARQSAQQTQQTAADINKYLNEGGKEHILEATHSFQDKAKQASNTLANINGYMPAIYDILHNAEQITITGNDRLTEMMENLPRIEKRVGELTDRVRQELPKAIERIQEASTFVRQDLPRIEEKVQKAADFVRDDLPGIKNEYKELADLLEEKMPEAEKAVHELADFAKTELPGLEKNVGELADRMREFEQNHDLSEIVRTLKDDFAEESDFLASPVQLNEEKLFPVTNYGSANAPFYTTLCLWVGALLLSNLVSTEVHPLDKRKSYTVRQMYVGRMLLFLFISFLQSLIVSLGNIHLLGVYTSHPVYFTLFTMFIGFTFMTIVYTLVSVFGNIGKALAIVLLVLQLSGSGGTFPVQVAPPFFQIIHPFLPFTYAINLLREAIGGIIPDLALQAIVTLLGFGLAALAFGLLMKKPLHHRIQQTSEKAKSSRLIE